MPWLVTVMERTTRPAGSFGMEKVYDEAIVDPPMSDARPARPVSLPTSILTTFGLGWSIFPTAPPSEELNLIASGPSAGSALTVRPGIGIRLVTVENETTKGPLILLIVAALNGASGRTPVAVACRLLITTCLTVKLLALMSIWLRSREATWVRNGNPSMSTDGLVPSPEESILVAIAFSAKALAPKSAATSTKIRMTSAISQRRPRCLRLVLGGRDCPDGGGCCGLRCQAGCCTPPATVSSYPGA